MNHIWMGNKTCHNWYRIFFKNHYLTNEYSNSTRKISAWKVHFKFVILNIVYLLAKNSAIYPLLWCTTLEEDPKIFTQIWKISVCHKNVYLKNCTCRAPLLIVVRVNKLVIVNEILAGEARGSSLNVRELEL